ncbi:MAG TPA: S9 family peptidase [Flavobacteriales bacterium]|nr:S9 family peptidase [Flavobacteriales bacterium]
MKKLLVIPFLFAGLLQAQDRMTPELLWKIGRVSGSQLSPDGKWILYGVTNYNLEANKGNRDLFVIAVTGGEPKKITTHKGSEFNECWKPDGKTIGYLSADNGSVQVWEVNADGTNAHAVTAIDGGINSFLYNAKGDAIVYTQDVKIDKSIVEQNADLPKAQAFATDDLMYRHWDTWHDNAYSHVFYMPLNGKGIDLMPTERFDAPLAPFGGIEQVAISPDGKTIVYTCKKKSGYESAKSTNSDLFAYNMDTKNTTNLTEGMMGYDVNPVYSSDGKWLAFLSMKRDGFEADKNDVVLMEVATGKKQNLTEKADITVNSFSWSKDNKLIHCIIPTEGTEQVYEIVVATGKMKMLTKGDADYSGYSISGTTLVGTKTTMNNPAELYKLDLKTGKETQLTFTNKELYSTIKTGKIEKRWIKTTDNKKLLTWVVYPPDFDATKKYPTLLYCQGGPQSVLSQFFSYRWNMQLMAANGYIVVAPCRRGMPSFGQKWNDDISQEWGGQVMQDYLSAIDSLAKEPFVNKDKLGAVGASYGGYSVYYLAGNHNNRFKAFISHCGLFNLESWYGTTEELFFADWEVGGPYWAKDKPKSYEAYSPHKFVQNWNTPILVIHDEKDFRVPFNQGMEAFQAAKIMGVPARFLSFPNENHWILSPQNSILWQREFFGWLDKWLK